MRASGFVLANPEFNKVSGFVLTTPALRTNPGITMPIALYAAQSLTIKGAKRDRQRKPGKEEKLLSFEQRGEKLLFGELVLDHGLDQWF